MSNIKTNLRGAWRWCRRYITLPLLAVAAYVAFVLFFNENSYSKSLQYQEQIDRLRAEIRQNNDTMAYYRALNASLDTDPATLERIVRENYHMKRPNEDVFVFE